MKGLRKRIAFCFSGHARTLDLCYPFIKQNFLDPLEEEGKDYDIFCCIEDDKDAHKVNLLKPTKIVTSKTQNFNKRYDHLINLNYKQLFIRGNINNQLNQLIKIQLANNLRIDYQKQNDVSYDWIIRTRFDIFPLTKIDYSNLDKKYLYLPQTIDLTHKNYNDIIALGNDKNINIYSDRIDSFEKIFRTYCSNDFPISQRVSFFLERIYIYIFEFLIKTINKDNFISKIFNMLIVTRSTFFSRPPYKNRYTAESGLFRYLESEKTRVKKLDLDYALVRDNPSESGLFLDKQKWLNYKTI